LGEGLGERDSSKLRDPDPWACGKRDAFPLSLWERG